MVDIKDIISQFENANERKCGVILGFEDTPIVEAALKAAVARMEHHEELCKPGVRSAIMTLPAEAEFAALWEKSK